MGIPRRVQINPFHFLLLCVAGATSLDIRPCGESLRVVLLARSFVSGVVFLLRDRPIVVRSETALAPSPGESVLSQIVTGI